MFWQAYLGDLNCFETFEFVKYSSQFSIICEILVVFVLFKVANKVEKASMAY